jgi:hypothetical protein
MSHDQYCRLQDIAKMLIDARDELEMLELDDVQDANALHGIISQAYWHCTRICHSATRELPVWLQRVRRKVYLCQSRFDPSEGGMTGSPNGVRRKATVEDLKQRCSPKLAT